MPNAGLALEYLAEGRHRKWRGRFVHRRGEGLIANAAGIHESIHHQFRMHRAQVAARSIGAGPAEFFAGWLGEVEPAHLQRPP